MLLTVSLRPEKPAGRSSKRARHERIEPGSIVHGTVLDVHALHADVQLSDGGSPQMPGSPYESLTKANFCSALAEQCACKGTQRTEHLHQLLALDTQVRGDGSTSWRPTSQTPRLLLRRIR